MSKYTNLDDIELNANYTFGDGITINADGLQRAKEKQKGEWIKDKIVKNNN